MQVNGYRQILLFKEDLAVIPEKFGNSIVYFHLIFLRRRIALVQVRYRILEYAIRGVIY
jgi:hypothetical protein